MEKESRTMINTKGEWIYTNAEIGYELGLSPATINAIGKRLFGNRIPHWTIADVRLIAEYIKSISIEEDQKRMDLLRKTIADVGFYGDVDDAKVRSDLHNV